MGFELFGTSKFPTSTCTRRWALNGTESFIIKFGALRNTVAEVVEMDTNLGPFTLVKPWAVETITVFLIITGLTIFYWVTPKIHRQRKGVWALEMSFRAGMRLLSYSIPTSVHYNINMILG